MRKDRKKQQGFTLVEVIVVAVIVAVLAAVAVPIYLNYVENSRTNQCNNIAGALASFCGACETNSGACSVAGAGPITGTCSADAEITIEVPDGFTAADATGAITVTYTADPTITSETYNYK
jgi:prepilin-type N-terminal cleavage/methylation domain-containing protein